MTLYRRSLVSLPLQRSLFSRIGRGAEALGLDDAAPADVGCLDDCGNLHVDEQAMQRLLAAVEACLDPDGIAAMEQQHRSRWRALAAATTHGAEMSDDADSLDDDELAGEIAALAARIADVLPYALIAKFLPDMLGRRLADAGESSAPPFPVPSMGVRLSEALVALGRECCALDCPPSKLAVVWPCGGEVEQRVRAFCRGHTGYGPLDWGLPGYEDPAFVVAALGALSAGSNGSTAFRQPDHVTARRAATERASSLRRYLAFWLAFLDQENWLVRRAYFHGLKPLLGQLAVRSGTGADRLVQLPIDDVLAGAGSTFR